MSFETQRVLRDRLGDYDVYGAMEDDLIIHDPQFFEKLIWFTEQHGDDGILQPHRYEQSKTEVLRSSYIDIEWDDVTAEFRSADSRLEVAYDWNGTKRTFYHANNPHAGCGFLTNDQFVAVGQAGPLL